MVAGALEAEENAVVPGSPLGPLGMAVKAELVLLVGIERLEASCKSLLFRCRLNMAGRSSRSIRGCAWVVGDLSRDGLDLVDPGGSLRLGAAVRKEVAVARLQYHASPLARSRRPLHLARVARDFRTNEKAAGCIEAHLALGGTLEARILVVRQHAIAAEDEEASLPVLLEVAALNHPALVHNRGHAATCNSIMSILALALAYSQSSTAVEALPALCASSTAWHVGITNDLLHKPTLASPTERSLFPVPQHRKVSCCCLRSQPHAAQSQQEGVLGRDKKIRGKKTEANPPGTASCCPSVHHMVYMLPCRCPWGRCSRTAAGLVAVAAHLVRAIVPHPNTVRILQAFEGGDSLRHTCSCSYSPCGKMCFLLQLEDGPRNEVRMRAGLIRGCLSQICRRAQTVVSRPYKQIDLAQQANDYSQP
eukprot:m.26351 g.26351  ORF g.26351 m.26351 type:complete len:421 (-) comp4576_c0_seq1:93-1355(-)